MHVHTHIYARISVFEHAYRNVICKTVIDYQRPHNLPHFKSAPDLEALCHHSCFQAFGKRDWHFWMLQHVGGWLAWAVLSHHSSTALQHEAGGPRVILLFHSKLKKSVHQEASIHIFLVCVLCAKPENNNPAEGCRLQKTKFFSLICTGQRSCSIFKGTSHVSYWCPWDHHKMCMQH